MRVLDLTPRSDTKWMDGLFWGGLPLWGIFHRASAQDESRKESVFEAEITGENPPGVGTGPEVAPRVTS